MTVNTSRKTIEFGGAPVTIEDIVAISRGASARITDEKASRQRIEASAQFVKDLWQEEGVIYGVTTGYGDSCTVSIPSHLVEELPLHLTRFHGCGLGRDFDRAHGRAILASRLASLSRGYSGVRMELLDRLADYIEQDIVPVVPEEGSVGASGDLTPLSYVAASLVGERDVYFKGERKSTAEVLQAQGITPLQLRPKEGLAIMNGTAVMTAIACLTFDRAQYLAKLATRLTAMVSVALKGNTNHFDGKLFSVKPHPGQGQIARWIHDDLQAAEVERNSDRLQDRYSVRCAPHIIGVLQDSLPWFRQFIETELNSANDNPIIDGEGEHVLHGGHFYGGHIAFAMDSLKVAVANVADLVDRQMALLMDVKFNNGLPSNLSGATPDRAMINHGFKAVQIGTSAWAAEALKNTMPASVFSRSTECHNQDKVSMGTIAARDCERVLELTEQVVAAGLLAATQAFYLRKQQGDFDHSAITPTLESMYSEVREYFDIVDEDRPLEGVLRQTIQLIRDQRWELYPND
ncbi:aromatic amino acid ammonia-lyase [Gilvimarinus agarilyticus]|uniref:HAL/PAL/TAL family ammonia-lyase n=1 Tax=Gilvimarinus sp. 2_MG-2023 TaxID=3062666 RepID=UPI001C08AC01|nr:aromatic amino acid ammonia-lyase [Gilvimarinus sp. 2_MG-2023]MBU2885707.1 aromatic amino acid ammonia-lyase [Gilvimarinus agarilyticus]MDO6570567.1 aromatic amino acid ammonia-lyase [Gilvimarinus sp. 2_MG-2023]